MPFEHPTGREWKLRPPMTGEAREMGGPSDPGSSGPSLPPSIPNVVAQILHSRGITPGSGIESFLNPQLHDPSLLPGIEAALDTLHRAINANETIGVIGDFDVDGVTGTALVTQGLRDLGASVAPYIPHRVDEGHGPNMAAVQTLKEQGASVLVTVDCGITSTEEVAFAQELGIDVIITDHHVPPPTLPAAVAIVDPKLDSSQYPFQGLSGGGLAFKLMQGLYDLLGRPWKRDLLELAALSTVADLVPLRGENRYLVKAGLQELRRTTKPGLQALYRHARVSPESIDAETISFAIAPRLNAAGRLDHASTSFGLLLTSSQEEAERLAGELEALNRERRRLTEDAYARAQEEVRSWPSLPSILLIEGDHLHPGIAGLVASRLVEEFHRPAVAMSRIDTVIRASARSIPEFDLVKDGLNGCKDLFSRYGGHPQAAGFEMPQENLALLKQRLPRLAEEKLRNVELRNVLDIDAEVPVASLVGETFRWLKELEPYGVDNPAPTFLSRNLRPVHARQAGVQKQHVFLKLKDGKAVWDAKGFRQGDKWVPDTPLLDVVYNIGTDWRNGVEVLGLNMLDFQPSTG